MGLNGIETLLPRLLNTYRTVYNPVSLVEAKWIVLKLAGRRPEKRGELLRRFREGLEALLHDERLSQTELTSPEIEEVADILLVEGGVPDYFDRLIYATATCRGSLLLTEDKELIQLAKRGDLPTPKKVIQWKDIAISTA